MLTDERIKEIFDESLVPIKGSLLRAARAIEAEVLQAQEPVAQNYWRDVSDELPKEAQEVLFVREGKTKHGAWIGGIFWHSNEKMVAAKWMPLPSPDNATPQPPAPCQFAELEVVAHMYPDTDGRLRGQVFVGGAQDGDIPLVRQSDAAAIISDKDAEIDRLRAEVERLPARRAQPTVKTVPIAPTNLAFYGIVETDEEFAERAGRKAYEVDR